MSIERPWEDRPKETPEEHAARKKRLADRNLRRQAGTHGGVGGINKAKRIHELLKKLDIPPEEPKKPEKK